MAGGCFVMEELMQKRIQNCIFARNNCKRNSWGYKFWNKTLKTLVQKGQRDGISYSAKSS